MPSFLEPTVWLAAVSGEVNSIRSSTIKESLILIKMNSSNKANQSKSIIHRRRKLRENLERSIIYRQLLGYEMNIRVAGEQHVKGTLNFSLTNPMKYTSTSRLLQSYRNHRFDLKVLPNYVSSIQSLTITGEVFAANSYVFNANTGNLNAVLKLSNIEDDSIVDSETKTEHEIKMYILIQQTPGMGDLFCKLYAYGTVYMDDAQGECELSACVLEDLGDMDVNKIGLSNGLFYWWSKGFQKIKQLHDLGFCHGDCKTNNIMLHNNRLTWIDPERVIPIISNFKQFTKNVLRLADITQFLYFNSFFLSACGKTFIDDIDFASLRKTMIQMHKYGKYLIWSNDFVHGAVVDDDTCKRKCILHFASNAFDLDGIRFFSELENLVSTWTPGIDEFINYLSIESNLFEFLTLLIKCHTHLPNLIVQTHRPAQSAPVKQGVVHSWSQNGVQQIPQQIRSSDVRYTWPVQGHSDIPASTYAPAVTNVPASTYAPAVTYVQGPYRYTYPVRYI